MTSALMYQHHSGMNLNDRAHMIRSIAEHWNDAVRLYETGNMPVLYSDHIEDLLLAGIARYAHEDCDKDSVRENTEALLKAISDLNTWETMGYLPDTMPFEDYSIRDNDEIVDLLNGDIDQALAPLLYGVTTADLCARCQQLHASVTTWRFRIPGWPVCAECRAERTAK